MTIPTSEGKTTAIISYIWFIGLIIAVIMNSKKDDFASYHIRNMIGLLLFSIATAILDKIGLPGIITTPVHIILFVLWVLGFIGAIQGEKKEIPVIGKLFQDWFKSI